MRIALAVVGICVSGAFVAQPVTTPSAVALKDRGAMMIYDGTDHVLALVPYADSANLALILLQQWQGDPVERSRLAGRPCVGVALFSKTEWGLLLARGRKPDEVHPSEAALRLRVYPATPDARAAVEDIGAGTAHIAIGIEQGSSSAGPQPRGAKTPFTWSLQAHLDKARGACTAK